MAAPDTSPIEGHEDEATRDQLAVAIDENDYSAPEIQAALEYENGPEGLGRKNATELLQGAFDEATSGPDTPDTSAEPAVTTATSGERDTSTDDESAPEDEIDVDEEEYLDTAEEPEGDESEDGDGEDGENGENSGEDDENDDENGGGAPDVTIDADEPSVPDGSPDVMTGMDVSLDEVDENNQVESRRLYDGGGATESGTAGVVLPAPGTADSPDTVRVFVPLEMNVGQHAEVLSPGVHDVEYTRQVKNQLETETNKLRLAKSDPRHPKHEAPTA